MEELTSEIDATVEATIVKKRSIQGVFALLTRTFVLYGISLIANFILTILLSPSEFGLFFVVSAIVNFLVYFSDVGLGAALIQKKDGLHPDDLATTFTIQQILVVSLISLAVLFSSQIRNFYNLNDQGYWLFFALLLAFFLSSLKTIPSILLERELQFNKLIIPQMLEQLTFYGIAVVLAWRGFGVTSYVFAVIGRGIVGLITMYILKPWRPRICLDKRVAKQLTHFGIPFQLNSLLGLIKDDLLILFLGRTISLEGMGYIRWGQQWSRTPFSFFSESLLKVSFPAYARLQSHKAELKKAIEKSIFVSTLAVFPALTGLIAIAPFLVGQIPHYAKWQPALIPLTLLSVNYFFSSVSTIITNALNALGKVKLTLKLMLMWIVLSWALTLVLIKLYDFNGYPLAVALTAVSSVITIYFIRKEVKIKVLPELWPGLVGSIVMYIFIRLVADQMISDLKTTFAVIIMAALVYVLTILGLFGKKVTGELRVIRNYIQKKQHG